MTIKILVWFIMSYGLMNIMVYGSIFQGLRNILKKWGNNKLSPLSFVGEFMHGIISCPLCFSTWGGFFLGYVIFSPINILFGINENVSWFFDGITSAGAIWTINSIVEWFEENRPNNK